MPQFNTRGDILAGVAGAVTTINGVPIVPGRCCGNWAWLHDDDPAGQVCDDAGCRVETKSGREISDVGTNRFSAGAGRWMADGGLSNFVSGPDYALAQPLWIDADGLAAVVMDYPASTLLRLVRTDNSIQNFPVSLRGPLYSGESFLKVNNGLFTFRTANGWQIWDDRAGNYAPNARPQDADAFMACRAGDYIIVIERMISDASIRVRFADQAQGFTVGTYGGIGNETYYPAIVALSAGTVRCGWSGTPDDLSTHVVDVAVNTLPGVGTTIPTTLVTRLGTTTPAPPAVTSAITAALKETFADGDVRTVLLVIGAIALVAFLETT